MFTARFSVALVLAVVALGPSIGCASPTTDDASQSEDAIATTERQAIMDALRAKVRPELKNQDIVFDVSQGSYKVSGGFAFLTGQIVLRATGKPVDYHGTEYQDWINEGAFDDHIDALLQKQSGKWVVKAHGIGSTDVEWLDWPARFGAPAAVFPFAPQEDPAQVDRRNAMDSLRAKLKPTLRNQDIVFNVAEGGRYNQKGDWLFMMGKIRLRGSGREVDYRGTEYQQYIDEGIFDDGFGALLHKQSGAWVVKDVAVGPTDVAWTGWDRQYGAPPEIFR